MDLECKLHPSIQGKNAFSMIYFRSVNYLAIYYPQLPFMQSRLQFRQGDVRPYSFYLSPWNNLSYQLGHHKSFIFMDYFKTPSEFHELFLTSDNTVKGQRHDQ